MAHKTNKNIVILRGKNFNVFPKGEIIPKTIKVLDLSHNSIEELPKNIKSFVNLRKLIVNNNKLRYLPQEIKELVNLEEIVLSNNYFDEFPKVLLQLKNLKLICLNNNRIKDIPENIITELPRLKNFYIKNNFLPRELEAIANKGSRYIKIYFENKKHYKQINKNQRVNLLKIQKLKIRNIGIFDEFEINFDEHVTCLIGVNGCGKTTIIRALALAITGINHGDIKDNLKNDYLKILKPEKTAEEAYIELSYCIDGIKAKSSYFLHKDLENLSITTNSLFLQKDSLDEFVIPIVGFIQNRNGEHEIQQKYKQPNIRELITLVNNRSENYLRQFGDWLITKKAQDEVAIIEKITEILSEIIDEKIEFSFYKDNIWVKNRTNPDGIPIEMLSLGFQDTFGWVGYFLQCMANTYPNEPDYWEKPAICIIDELDTYLHPLWQAKALKILQKNFINTQFIISTHSPFIIEGLVEEQIVMLTKDGRAKYNEEPVWGWLYGDIIREFFQHTIDFSHYDTYKLKQDIKNMEKLVQQGDEEAINKLDNLKYKLKRLENSISMADGVKDLRIELEERKNELDELIVKVKQKLNS